jgi:hypothetical protein
MRRPAVDLRRRGSRASLLLLALLLFRAYVPVGFMPASGVPFALELCPAAMAAMPAGHNHGHTGTHADLSACPFGSAPAAGPISHRLNIGSAGPALSQPLVALAVPRFSRRSQRTHQPRGPPSLV